MIKKRILFILVLCLFLFIPIVNAETQSGNFNVDGTVQIAYPTTSDALNGNNDFHMYAKGIQYTAGTQTVVDWTNEVMSFTGGAPDSASTSFTGKWNNAGNVRFAGSMGYQRLFNALGVEQPGYTWIWFSQYDVTGLTGDGEITLTFNNSQVYDQNINALKNNNNWMTNGNLAFSRSGGITMAGNYTSIKSTTFKNDWIAVKPSGIGITGNITKTVGGTAYGSKTYILNGLGTPITSESTVNTNNYNFSVPSQTTGIIIALQDAYFNWHNTSVLFYTATPTPTPTPYGTGTYNATFTVKNASSSLAISQAFVEIEDLSTKSVFSGYTDSNGQITISYGYAGVQNEFRAWKTGYQYVNWIFTPTGGSDFTKTIYMYPEIGSNPSTPATVNITMYVKAQNGNTPISGAYVALKDDSYGTSKQAQYTNASGVAYFPNFPVSAFIDLEISKSGYVPLTEYFGFTPSSDFGMTKYLTTTGGITPTPTPTPVTYDTLGLTATPDTISLGQTVSLTGTSSNATRLTYAGGLRRTVFMVNKHAQAYPFDFQEIGMFENVNATYWKFRSSYSSAWGVPSTASPLTMTNVPDTTGTYTYAFIGYETIAGGSGAIATAGTDDVTVNGGSGAGSLIMNLFAYDGSNTNHLSNYQMNITDDNSGVVSELGNVSYEIARSLPRGSSYTLRASKENYEYGSKTFIVPISPDIENGDFGTYIGVPLFPEGTLSAGNTTVTVHVDDIETYYPLGNVQVVMSYDGSTKYTGSSGESVYWIIPQNTPYTVKAIKSGYCSVTESKNTGTNDYQYVPLFMKYGACQGATPTPTPTITPTVTVTPIGGWGNTTGGAIVCNQLPEDATFVDILKNSLACNGLKDAQSQSLGIACIIILLCAIVLGRIAKGIGVLSGVVAGTVLSTVAGFIPFWVIIVVIIIAGLVFAGKVFWSNGG